MEKPVKFLNRKGQTLFGMLYVPENMHYAMTVGILISIDSIKSRIGAYRFNTLLARYLCQNGFYVMTFDPTGTGDSEGDFEDKYLNQHFVDIQKGRYCDDIIDAVHFFKTEIELDKVVLLGLCGGAVSVLLSAYKGDIADALILLAMPVLLEDVKVKTPEEIDETELITSKEQAVMVLLPQIKNLFYLDTWNKILTSKIEWKHKIKTNSKALYVLLSKQFEVLKNKIFNQSEIKGKPKHPRFNYLVLESFKKVISKGGKVLFVFGELDFVTWLFKSEFQEIFLPSGNKLECFYEIHVIKNANHIFAGKVVQNDLQKTIVSWLNRVIVATEV